MRPHVRRAFHFEKGYMKQIPLFSRVGEIRGVAIVDDSDYEIQWQHRWSLVNGYACRSEGSSHQRNYVHIFMHREILGLPRKGHDLEGDHINADRLDNRRENLREVTHAQNMQNRLIRVHKTSIYRGVHWESSKAKWRAAARLNNRHHHIGYFSDEEQAASAAQAWRQRNMTHTVEHAAIH
jgi:hypothetical protein